MNFREKKDKCRMFLIRLSEELATSYELVGSCNHDSSLYLIPNGTSDELTYHSKPDASFRFSDHWNWYANLNKCADENYIQCHSVDLPWAKQRIAEGKSSKAVVGFQVAQIGPDGNYHAVYGEVFDRKNKTWRWIESDPVAVARKVQ